ALAESLLAHSAASLGTRPSRRRPTAPEARPSGRPSARSSARTRGPKQADRRRRASVESRPGERELGYYVYGVVSAGGEDLPPDLPGVDPRYPATLVGEGGLAAIVSRVSLEEFGEERLRDNLNDVAWLEDKARAHEEVLDAALQ